MESAVLSFERGFNEVNAYKLNFKKEASFALQILKANDFLRNKASANPDSLQAALTNIAAIGITLNPALKEGYLVPRGNQVCLDISYIGLIKLATDTGAIEWVQAEIVKAKDTFKYLGVGKAPLHEMNPFSDRGEVIGVYCVARLASGEFLSTVMSKQDCDAIRDKSSQSAQKGPWKDFYEEMLKKTVIKRASKLWPKSERVQHAVEVINEHEGIDFSEKGAFMPEASSEIVADEKAFKNIRDLLAFNKKTEEGLLKFINTQFQSEVKSIEEMDARMIEASYRAMGGKK
jgi:recombination protein RecT